MTTRNQINQSGFFFCFVFFPQLQLVEIHVEGAVTHSQSQLKASGGAETLCISQTFVEKFGETLQMDQLTKAENSFVVLFLNKNAAY